MTSAANQAALEAEHLRPLWFIHLDFAIDPLYACTANRSYLYDGNSYLGVGEIQGISNIPEGADIAARPITIIAAGTDSWITTPIQNRTNYKGRAAAIYKGYLDANLDLIDDPEPKWFGRMDVGSMTWDAGSFTAQMTCEPLQSRLLRANISRYSDEDHQLRHPGDKFFEFLPQMAEKDVIWGGNRVSPGIGGGQAAPPRSAYDIK